MSRNTSVDPVFTARKSGWFSTIFLAVALLLAAPSLASATKQISVVFRYDDYSSISSTDIEMKIIKALKVARVPCTFGVIPFRCAGFAEDPTPQKMIPLTPFKAQILRQGLQAGILEVALHGFSHQNMLASSGRYSEFAGRSYGGQELRIVQGKAYLEKMLGTRIVTFVPPWDHYDLNTISILEKHGFRNLSASIYGIIKVPSRISYLPGNCDLRHLRLAVEYARRSNTPRPIVVVLFHQYDFQEVDKTRGRITFSDFVNVLGWVKGQKDLKTYTVNQALAIYGNKGLNQPQLKSFVSNDPSSGRVTPSITRQTNTLTAIRLAHPLPGGAKPPLRPMPLLQPRQPVLASRTI